MQDVEIIRTYLRGCMFVAAFSATAFPILYGFSRWNDTWLGRTLMLQAVSLAIALDLTVIARYWKPGIFVITTVYAFIFTFLAIATAALTYQMWKQNHILPKKRKKAANERSN